MFTREDNNEKLQNKLFYHLFSKHLQQYFQQCNLCLTEKLYIIKADKASNLNKRTELISICRYEKKYSLVNINTRLQ